MAELLPDGAWVAVQVQYRSEYLVCVGLEKRNYETFLPLQKEPPKLRDLSMRRTPLFPGYVFCRWCNSNNFRIVQVPRVVRLLGVGSRPLPIDEGEIEKIRRIVTSNLTARPWRFLQEGDRARIIGGPLCGLEAIIVTVADDRYAVVNVTLMKRAVAVKIHPSLLASCNDNRIAA